MGDAYYSLLTHTIADDVGTGVTEDALPELILPVVVVSESAKGSLDAAQDNGHIGVELTEDTTIDNGGVFRTTVVPAIRTVSILRPQSSVGGVFVHHRVHTPR